MQATSCTSPDSGLATNWSVVLGNFIEGGTTALRAAKLQNTSEAWGPGTACTSNGHCAAGEGCCDWAAAGGCLTAVVPNIDIQLSLATALLSATETPLTPVNVSHGPLSASATFSLKANEEYVLRFGAASNRTGMAPQPLYPHDAAAALVAPGKSKTWRDVATIERDHANWWAQWWNASAIDLGPSRQLLEGFYYGAHYMLGCFRYEAVFVSNNILLYGFDLVFHTGGRIAATADWPQDYWVPGHSRIQLDGWIISLSTTTSKQITGEQQHPTD